MDNWTGAVIANYTFLITGIFGAYYLVKMWLNNDLTDEHYQLLAAWGLIFASISINKGFWGMAGALTSAGVLWNPELFQYRHVMGLITASMFVYGMILFIDAFVGIKKSKRLFVFITAFILATIAAYFT